MSTTANAINIIIPATKDTIPETNVPRDTPNKGESIPDNKIKIQEDTLAEVKLL